MQVSQLFRRSIVVPRDDSAEAQLRTFDVSPDIGVNLLSLDDDPLFYRIWEAGIFHRINEACGTLIDEYEEEILEPAQMEPAIAALVHGVGRPSWAYDVREFRDRLVELLREAREARRPAVFVL